MGSSTEVLRMAVLLSLLFLAISVRSFTLDHGGDRIIGGTDVDIRTFPYHAYLVGANANYVCGGFLISTRKIVTAAHCCDAAIYGPVLGAVLGVTSTGQPNPGQQNIDVIGTAIYPPNPNNIPYLDVCVVTLQTYAQMTQYVTTIDIPAQGTPLPAGKHCKVTGFGGISPGIPAPSPNLKMVEVTVRNPLDCVLSWGQYFDQNRMICAGDANQNTCNGDSGGALMCVDAAGTRSYAAGIVHRGGEISPGVCDPRIPTLYMLTSSFTDWIRQQ